MVALKPWLLGGKPNHYESKGLKLYMAHGLERYWLQLEDEAMNPYGAGHPMQVEWPDKVEAEAPKMNEMPQGVLMQTTNKDNHLSHDPTKSFVAKVIDWSVHNQLLIGMMMLALLVAGILSVQRTPLDAIPDMSDTGYYSH